MLDPATVFDDSGPLEDPLTDEALRAVQAQLGHKLPTAYVDLARRHNGGSFARDAHPAPNRTSWAEDHIGVYTLAAIGRTARFSLCGELGSAFWVTEWGYPDIGIYIADCPSAGAAGFDFDRMRRAINAAFGHGPDTRDGLATA